jgi:hypothetical protein
MKLETYSHNNFFVTGYEYWVDYKTLDKQMSEIWGDKDKLNNLQNVKGTDAKEKGMYVVYYNKNEFGFNMLIGLVTTGNVTQDHEGLKFVEIPTQNYKYASFDFSGPSSVAEAWKQINSVSTEELRRSFMYDLEIYSADMKTFTIAVSV